MATTTDFEPSPAMRWMLAALSFAAGVIHLVMVPQHAQESTRVGLAFAAAGWFQIAFGIAVVVRPSRGWIRLGIVANVVFVAVWVFSRTVGLPDWTGDGGIEKTKSVDALCVGFEIAIIVVAAAVLVAPRLLDRWTRPVLLVGIVVGGILVATTAVLASPSTANHAHDEAVDHDGSGEHVHTDGVALGTATHTHDAAAASSSSASSSSSSQSAAGHHHNESTITYDELPPTTKAEVDEVIAGWGTKYATAADAMKDGWVKATRDLYGIGAHYVRTNIVGLAAPFDLTQPNILLFDGEGPDAKFAGVSYIVGGAKAPKGFAGSYDGWHTHTSVCFKGGTVVSLNELDSPIWYSEPECIAAGGTVIPLASDQMLHLWIGPDYINGAPIFAHDHPLLFNGYDPKRDG
jgi:gas vesicle protein